MRGRCRFPFAFALAMALPPAAPAALAQARAGDGAAVPSPVAALFLQIDEALAPRLIGADDAASHWISARFSSLDPAMQARDYAAAVAREPRELLYVASLADACLRAGGAPPRECSERDPVGYWASRDPDNAVPWLLQSERARRRNNVASLVENLDRASRSSRYDTYDQRAGAVVWSKVATATPASERGAAALYALGASSTSGAALQALEGACAPQSRALDPRIPAACTRLAALMAERASLLSDRRAGTQIALAVASGDRDKLSSAEQARNVVAQQDRCREALQGVQAAAVGTTEQRQRAAMLGEQFVTSRAREGESSACEALGKAAAVR